jgi:hypothetical protein
MLSTLFAAAAAALTALLPLPLPTDPATAGGTTPTAAQVEVSGALDAPDGRLKRGCKDYRYAYSVTTGSDDWTFDITLQDRRGKGVNSQSLLGPNDDEAGVLNYRLCRWATVAGRFTLSGVLVSYDGDRETSVPVTETFRLRRTRS